MDAQAATKTVKNIDFSTYRTEKIKKKATTVKKGTTTLKLSSRGYVKFKATATKTYSFKFSGMTGPMAINNGFAYILLPEYKKYSKKYDFEKLQFSTAGGKTDTAWYSAKKYADTKKTTGAFLATRTCKVKLKKGQYVYLYLCFASNGKINLTIK